MRIPMFALLLPWAALSAQAASFDCRKAAAPVERAVCSEPQLDALDARLGRAYRALLDSLPVAEAAALQRAQRAWLKTRDSRCAGDFGADCLLPLYRQRVAALEFRQSPAYSASPAARARGEYTQGGAMSMEVEALAENRVAVYIFGAEPTTARWICEFSGEGEIAADGALSISADEGKLVRIVFAGDTAQVDEGPDSGYYCGAGGTLSGEYRKRRR